MIGSAVSRFMIMALLTLLAIPAFAQVDALILTFTGRELVKSAADAAQRAISQAELAGNGLISKFGSELAVAAANADLVLGSNIDKAAGRLDPVQKNMLGQLSQMTQTVAALSDSAYDLKDTAAIDMAQLADASIFASVPYYIRRVDGVAQVVGEADYRMRVLAFGLAPGTEGKSSQLSFFIGT